MAKKRLRVLLNGKAAGRDDVRRAIHDLRDDGHDVSVRVTWEAGDVDRLVNEALSVSSELDVLIAGGGDGTINEVAGALGAVSHKGAPSLAMGILPLGTANDFARGIGLDPSDLSECLQRVVAGEKRPLDLGQINDRYFVNMATGGFGAQVTTETDPRLKSLIGGAAYLFTGLSRFSELASFEGVISGPDFSWEGEFLALALGNGKQAGGGVVLCPSAEIDDGLLDVSIIPAPKAGDASEVLELLLEKGLAALNEKVISAQVSSLSIETARPLQINLDGEPVRGERFEVSVAPGRLELVL